MLITIDLKSKEALKSAIKAKKAIGVFASNDSLFNEIRIRATEGRYRVQGPWSELDPNRWEAVVVVKKGKIVKVE